jgi:hypothetical protein
MFALAMPSSFLLLLSGRAASDSIALNHLEPHLAA